MTATDDPLLPFLLGELEQISDSVGLARRMLAPSTVLDDDEPASLIKRWTFQFTWQQVERARRYVIPLPREIAIEAQRSTVQEVDRLLLDGWPEQDWAGLLHDPRVDRSAISVDDLRQRLEPAAAGRPIRHHQTSNGAIGFVDDDAVLALPLGSVQRRVRFNSAMNVYVVSESIQVGRPQLLDPEAVCIWSSANE